MTVRRSWFPAARIGSRASRVCALAGVSAAAFMMATIAGCGSGGGPRFPTVPPPPITSAIVVANPGSAGIAGLGSSVTSYPVGTTSDPSPATNLTGTGTLILSPGGVVQNAVKETFVTSDGINGLLTFAPGATGNSGPIGIIACLAALGDCATPAADVTQLESPFGVSPDLTGAGMVVANTDIAGAGAKPFGNVELFDYLPFPATPGTLPFGNAAPSAIIKPTGATTDLMFGPADAIEDPAAFDELTDTVWVSNFFGNLITVYKPFSTGVVPPPPASSSPSVATPPAVVDATPIAVITADISKPEFMVFGAGNELLYVANAGSNTVSIYAVADVEASPEGGAKPRAILGGSLTGIVNPIGVALDSNGNLYVASQADNGAIMEFGELELGDATGITAEDNVAPIGQLIGPNTLLHVPTGIFVPPSPRLD